MIETETEAVRVPAVRFSKKASRALAGAIDQLPAVEAAWKAAEARAKRRRRTDPAANDALKAAVAELRAVQRTISDNFPRSSILRHKGRFWGITLTGFGELKGV